MKKDIQIPLVEGVQLAIVQEYNPVFKTNDHYIYLINEKKVDLEFILIVSKGFDKNVETSTMRHKIEILPSHSFAKVELIQEEVLQLNNEFKITFFENNKMFEKNFLVKKNIVKEGNFKFIKSLNKKGIIIE
jgi:hypothetical protein